MAFQVIVVSHSPYAFASLSLVYTAHFFYLSSLLHLPSHTHTHTFAHQYPLSLKTRRLLNLHLAARAVVAVKVAELVDQQVVPGPPLQVRRASLLPTRMLVVVAEVEHGRQLVPGKFLPPEGREKSMLVPLRTVVGHSFYIHTPSYTYTHLHAHTHTHTHTHTHIYPPIPLKTRRLLNLHLAAWAMEAIKVAEAVKVAELVDQQVVPGPPLQVRRTNLLPTRTLVIVAEVEHGRHLVPWQILPPEGREKSMLIPLRTVVGHSFYTHTPSYTYTHLHAHTHTHICPPIPSITQDEETAKPSSGSKGRGGRQGRGVGRPAGCPRATLASKKSKPSSDKDAGHCGRGRTRTSAGAMAISPTGGKGEEHADTSEDSGRSLILHSHRLVYIYTLTRTHTPTFAHQYPLSLKTRRLLNLHLAARAVEAVKVTELVDQQVVPGPPLQVRRTNLLPTRTLVVVAEVEHGRHLVPWQILPPEGREKSMLIPLRTVVGHSFYIHTPSYTYTHLHAHTHTHMHPHPHLPTNTLYHSRRGDC